VADVQGLGEAGVGIAGVGDVGAARLDLTDLGQGDGSGQIVFGEDAFLSI